jgi:hypothetical protein
MRAECDQIWAELSTKACQSRSASDVRRDLGSVEWRGIILGTDACNKSATCEHYQQKHSAIIPNNTDIEPTLCKFNAHKGFKRSEVLTDLFRVKWRCYDTAFTASTISCDQQMEIARPDSSSSHRIWFRSKFQLLPLGDERQWPPLRVLFEPVSCSRIPVVPAQHPPGGCSQQDVGFPDHIWTSAPILIIQTAKVLPISAQQNLPCEAVTVIMPPLGVP